MILQEGTYEEQMENVVEPYLAARVHDFYIERKYDRGIHCIRYTGEHPRGIVLICHGYTEFAEKYKEVSYYFVKMGYCVYIPEHCGHGFSYRLTDDLSIVYVDSYLRYVEDFIQVAELARKEYSGLPLFIYAHSMGGGIAAAAAAERPDLFKKIVLSSPMIRPLTRHVPWCVTKGIMAFMCACGKEKDPVMGMQPYKGPGVFENSTSLSLVRFARYSKKRENEPLYQGCCASYGWVHEAAQLNCFLRSSAVRRIRASILLFQSEYDDLVSAGEQERFVRKIANTHNTDITLVRVPGSKHELYSSEDKTLRIYWKKIFRFLK